MWKKRFRNSAVRIARVLGYLNDQQAEEADRLLEAHPDDATQDLLIHAQYLTASQAEVVAMRRKREDPEDHLEDRLKYAQRIQKNLTDTGLDAARTQRALAKKVGAKG